ncbi:cation transport ATPase [Liquorilactobacillus sucicola DSM 21376 = JCM 15457]|uniref:Cation transport ATPase n=1 Tax=Liquorilactobacillus sucicola DSM 21376 = JCM 15457 TaxID=1423806 RepID=A0A023CY69_9LACO|nr:HAD-IC family P-type ATPase [Liquorilactobacillus sucicola]KRN07633.1 cation transport ATPase [Liquorilactobacillus sucicola DSM 21376 = JCM 15457]GAJ26734.1 cation transport ATPase [Liquorilactobacillus sucicola DSM 21376 = JCM 15457]
MQEEKHTNLIGSSEDNDDSGPRQQLWQKKSEELETEFKTHLEQGLTSKEAERRLEENGKNELVAKKTSNWLLFFKQFNNSITYILAATAVVTLLLRHYPDSSVIGAVIVANALVGFFQEVSADNALSKIKELLVSECYVVRDGHKVELPAKQVVVGDIIRLEAGDAVPADLRLVSADNMKIQESNLTGETDSVIKTEEAIDLETLPLAERTNMAFAATAVTSGSGVGIVVATGAQTEIGHIQQDVVEVKSKVTPLMQNLNKLGWALSLAIVAVAILMFALGAFLRVYSLPTLLIAVITMIVGSMPEGMPASVSVVLAMGTRKLTRKKAIVKTLPAVETLGAVSIVNTDKTGTLTKNEMTVTDIITADGQYTVSGVGYDATGQIQKRDGTEIDWKNNEKLKWMIQIAGQTTDASFHQEDGRWVLTGEPTDGALTGLFHKFTGKAPSVEEIDSLPFDSAFRYSARLALLDDRKVLMVKGAPQTLFERMKKHGSTIEEHEWLAKMEQLTKQGKRVVALGYQQADEMSDKIITAHIGRDFHLVGMVGIIDPPRQEVAAAIRKLRYAGIKVKMITGDDPNTAMAIAKQLKLADRVNVITGPELDKMSDEQLTRGIDKYTVFARTTPSDKLKIVRAQQKRGHVVSMTGDGVNDAPALKQADIGVAMGIKGTDVAKSSADMVLADDNFTTILTAVKEGRHIFDNIRKTIRFLLPTSFAEGLIVVMSILLDQTMPLYPTQLLWINMVSALTIQFAFIFEPAEKGIMTRGPRKVNQGILKKADIIEITYVSLLISGLGMIAYDIMTKQGMSAAVGSTMTLNVIIFGKIFYLFNMRNSHPVLSRYFFQNKMAFYIIAVLLVLQAGIIYLPFMQEIFHTTAPGWIAGWGVPIVAGIIVLIVTEIIKYVHSYIYRMSLKKSS